MHIQEQILLAPLTTFKIGGPARFFVRVQSVEELREALDFARDKALKIFILGGGSNVLMSDEGFDGLVVKIEIKGIEEKKGEIVAGAGEEWDAVVRFALERELWGVENLSGIPGSVGGAVVQGIGAYGQAVGQTLQWVEVFDRQTGKVKKLNNTECLFNYRGSVFKQEEGRYVVLHAVFKFKNTPEPNISYKDLTARFIGQSPSLLQLREAILDIRSQKFPNLSVEGSAGSFFKNPVLPQAQAQVLARKYPGMPLFSLPESSDIKVPLGWFLDFRHGVIDLRDTKIGGARMYEKHFLVLAAERNTSSKDVKKLAQVVQEKVEDTLGIAIEPEVKMV